MKMCASSKKLIAHMKFELQKNSAGAAFDAALSMTMSKSLIETASLQVAPSTMQT